MTNPTRTCCGFVVKSGKSIRPDGAVVFGYYCDSCGRKGYGDSPAEAAAAFDASRPTAPTVNKIAPPRPLVNAADLAACIADRSSEIASIAAPFVKADRPAFALMVKKTTRYVMGLSGDSWAKVWATPEGRDSIIAAMEEAFQLGATLPDMGCMVPFGGIAEFIPDVEAYRFAVTTGASAPFLSLEIEPIFKNDKYHITRKEGDFSITFDSILASRGDVIAVAVYGAHRSGKTLGEVYPVDRLVEKARVHSQSYRTYLQDVAAFESAKVEGKLKKQDGREYVEKAIPKRDGGTWNKRIYLDELTNPYDGADRPEMLRKLAGKSFLAPYIKTRNSTAAINELQEDDDVSAMLDAALDQAFDAMPADRPTDDPHPEDKRQSSRHAIPEPNDDLAPPPAALPSEKPDLVTRKKPDTKEELSADSKEPPADGEENVLF